MLSLYEIVTNNSANVCSILRCFYAFGTIIVSNQNKMCKRI